MRVKKDKEFERLSGPISSEAFQRLRTDILANGCREPILTWNGIIVDGYGHYEICQKSRTPFQTKEVQELQGKNREGAMFWILSRRLGKEDLTDYQRGGLLFQIFDVVDRQVAKCRPDDERRGNLMETKKNMQASTGLSDKVLEEIRVIESKGTLEQIQRARIGGGGNSVGEIYREIVGTSDGAAVEPEKPEGTENGGYDFSKVRFETKNIKTSQLSVDMSYQRALVPGLLNDIVQNFNPCAVRQPRVSLRDGKYYVFDGQHTMTALKYMNGGKDLEISCLIYYGLTKEMEAYLFHLQDGAKASVRAVQDLRALVVAKNPRVLGFLNLTRSYGFTVNFETRNSGKNRIVAVNRAFTIYDKDPELYEEMLSLLRRTWDGDAESLRDLMLAGLYEFVKANHGKYDFSTFVKKLSVMPPHDIFVAGKRMGGGDNARFANQLIYAYNKRLLEKRRLPEIQLYG